MFVAGVIDQYLKTTDNDLKYMALRQDFAIREVDQDLDQLVRKVLLPVLLEETDSEIVDLVSFEVYPKIVIKCVNLMKTSRQCESRWFDEIIVEPLTEQIRNRRGNFIVQTLRNVLKVVAHDYNDTKICIPNEKWVERLVSQMRTYNDGNGVGQNMVIYWETLDLLISLYYDSLVKMSFEVLSDIFILSKGKLDELVKSVLASSIDATTQENVAKITKMSIVDDSLDTISSVWWQFGSTINILFKDKLLPATRVQQVSLLPTMQTLYNLRAFYEIPSVEQGALVLREELLEELAHNVQQVQQILNAAESAQANGSPIEEEMEVEDFEVDDDQQAYLEQLQTDNDLEFENESDSICDGNGGNEANDNHYEISRLSSLILEAINDNKFETDDLAVEKPINLNHVKANALTEVGEIQTVLQNIRAYLKLETSLSALLVSLEVLNQLLVNSAANIDGSQICESLLPHMRQNKSFLQTIKVGNMTQTIDEGNTFRTMVYSTILQILATHDVHYVVCCRLLKEAVSRGARDPDTTVNRLSIGIMETLLQQNYNKIKGIDRKWYNETLIPKVADVKAKLHKRLQLGNDVDAETEREMYDSISTVILCLEKLFNSQYPLIS